MANREIGYQYPPGNYIQTEFPKPSLKRARILELAQGDPKRRFETIDSSGRTILTLDRDILKNLVFVPLE